VLVLYKERDNIRRAYFVKRKATSRIGKVLGGLKAREDLSLD